MFRIRLRGSLILTEGSGSWRLTIYGSESYLDFFGHWTNILSKKVLITGPIPNFLPLPNPSHFWKNLISWTLKVSVFQCTKCSTIYVVHALWEKNGKGATYVIFCTVRNGWKLQCTKSHTIWIVAKKGWDVLYCISFCELAFLRLSVAGVTKGNTFPWSFKIQTRQPTKRCLKTIGDGFP